MLSLFTCVIMQHIFTFVQTVNMNMFTLMLLLLLEGFYSVANNSEINRLLSQIHHVGNDCIRNSDSKLQTIIEQLETIKFNLIFNTEFHDGINSRELENMYQCSLNAFNEQLKHLRLEFGYNSYLTHDNYDISVRSFYNTPEERDIQLQVATPTISKQTSKTGFNYGESPQILGDDTMQVLRRLEKYTQTSSSGEFLQAVDTLAHFVQTRLQHETKHASFLAQISTTLIRKVISEPVSNFANRVRITAQAVQKLANLAQTELEENREGAHVELFIAGLSNLLLVARNLEQNLELGEEYSTQKMAFVLNGVAHTVESIFPGTDQVKRALAIEALSFARYMKEMSHVSTFNFLKNFEVFEETPTNKIIQEISSEVQRASNNINDHNLLSILTKMKVRFQNIFRMSHEDNTQVLFLHITSTLPCVDLEDILHSLSHMGFKRSNGITQDNVVEWIEKLIIDAYGSLENVKDVMEILHKLLEDIQILCINKYLYMES